jgi:hypothetical protein
MLEWPSVERDETHATRAAGGCLCVGEGLLEGVAGTAH